MGAHRLLQLRAPEHYQRPSALPRAPDRRCRRSVPAMKLSFFAAPTIRDVDGRSVEWFSPTDHCRGPWDADACHAGPPTGLLVRAMQRALPDVRLARITVDLAKPIPMSGFHIDAEVTRRGKTVAGTRATIVDADGVSRVSAIGLHVAEQSRSRGRGTTRQLRRRDTPARRRRARTVPDRGRSTSRACRVQRRGRAHALSTR